MAHKKIYPAAILLFLAANMTHAQLRPGNSRPTNNFFAIQKKFYETYGEEKDNHAGETRDGAMEKFKRWEWYWESRVDKYGNFPPANVIINEKKAYEQRQARVSNRLAYNSSWSFYGPNSSVGGYYGVGRINCIAFHPSDPNTFWIGTPSGGVWKTTNGGSSWSTTSDDLPVLGVAAIVVNPLNPNILFLATGDGEFWNTNSAGILKSTNGGDTWAPTGLSWDLGEGREIRELIMNPDNPDVMIAASTSGIFKTVDGGNTWTNPETNGHFFDVKFKPGDPGIVYASTWDYWGGNTEIYTSTDGGDTWSVVKSFSGTVCRISLSVSPASPNEVVALCARFDLGGNRGLNSMWRSTNSGGSYAQILSGACSQNYLSREYPLNSSTCDGQGEYDLVIASNPQNANELWMGGVNSWKSVNGGVNWSIKNYWDNYQNPVQVVHADKHAIEYNPVNNKIYECNDGGLFVSNDGGSNWTNLTNGLGITQIYRIGTAATLADKVLCGTQDNGLRQVSSGNWSSLNGGDVGECIVDFTNAGTEYICRYDGEVQKSTNGGSSWYQVLGNQGSGANEAGEWMPPMVMNPSNSSELIIGKSQVYKTSNGGSNWSQLGNITGITYGKLMTLAYAPSNTQVIYVASRKEMYRTSDGGQTWNQLNVSFNTDISEIAVSDYDQQKLWVVLKGYYNPSGVLESDDGGNTWTDYSGTLPEVPVNCIVYQNGSIDGLYIGTDYGVFYRDASMNDWAPFDNGLPNVVINDLKISYINSKIWAGTYGRGLWQADLIIGINETDLSRSVSVYPNPTQGIFTISSSLPSQNFSVRIKNILGEEVFQTLFDSGSLDIDLSKEKNGVYFVEIGSGKGVAIKKLVLNKTIAD